MAEARGHREAEVEGHIYDFWVFYSVYTVYIHCKKGKNDMYEVGVEQAGRRYDEVGVEPAGRRADEIATRRAGARQEPPLTASNCIFVVLSKKGTFM